MTEQPHKPIPPSLSALLAGLRQRIRTYVWAEGIAVLLALLGFAFWATLGFDWIFEPPVPLRIALLVIVSAGALWVFYRYILRRAFVGLADRTMALLLERRFRSLQDSLLTVVELAEHGSRTDDFNPAMVAETEREALAGASQVRLSHVLNMRPLVRRISIAALLVASVLGFSVAARDAFGIWVRRSLFMSDEIWPRKTHLIVEEFDNRATIKVARGSDLDLTVKADAAPGKVVPDVVEVRFSSADGARVRENMTRQGEAAGEADKFQRFAYTFKGILAPIEFYVLGGDDRRGPFHVEVVDSPAINQMVLHCEYPPYMKRTPRDISGTGMMAIPKGTNITIKAKANKPLWEAQIDDTAEGRPPVTQKLSFGEQTPRQEFEFEIKNFQQDTTLLFTLLDSDNIKSRDPMRLALSAVVDEPPRVGTRLTGIGTAITPTARLPIVGDLEDDYALGSAWFEYHIDEKEPKTKPFVVDPAGRGKLEIDEALEVGPLELQPKQKLHLVAQAADTYDLTGKPNVGASQKYVLDVVTPAQLRSMLEARELQLRQRFETVMQEFTETRDLLARIEVASSKSAEKDKTEGSDPKKKPPSGLAEPGDEPGDEVRVKEASEDTPAAASARRKVQASRVVQNSSRSADETRGVAVAFDDIRIELINNRVDTEELKTRLKDGISDPLRRIADERFPELSAKLKALEAAIDNPAEARAAQNAARQQADIILVEMKQVLDNMLELETFNEALDLLRAIIKGQEEINGPTKELQKAKLRNLLEE